MATNRTILLALTAALAGCQPPPAATRSTGGTSAAPPPPPGAADSSSGNVTAADEEAALISAYRAAHASRDVDAMLKLYWLEGVTQEMREVARENIAAEMRHPIKAMKFGPPPAGPLVRDEGGSRWRDSLPPVAVLTVDFDVSRKAPGEWAVEQAELAVGRKGSKLYFTATVQE
jgi:hypothetical protein